MCSTTIKGHQRPARTEHIAGTDSCLPRWKPVLSQVRAVYRAQCRLPEPLGFCGLTHPQSAATARLEPQHPPSSARIPASASRTARPVVKATREALTPNPARPRPSRSPAQHGDGQPGSGAAAARWALGAAGRWLGLTRCRRPASVCCPRPASLRHRSRSAASVPLAQAFATLGGRSRGEAARAGGRSQAPRPSTVRISRVGGGAGPRGAEAGP